MYYIIKDADGTFNGRGGRSNLSLSEIQQRKQTGALEFVEVPKDEFDALMNPFEDKTYQIREARLVELKAVGKSNWTAADETDLLALLLNMD
jgi:hypothetical protein